MRVTIAARRCDLPDAVRERTEKLIGRLKRYDPRISAADVVYEEEKRTRRVEVILSVDGAPPVVARAEGEEFRTALDKVTDRIGRVIRRNRSQVTDHQAQRPTEGIPGD